MAVVRHHTACLSAPEQLHTGGPFLQIPLSRRTRARVGQVPAGDAEMRTSVQKVPTHVPLVALGALCELSRLVAAGAETERRVRTGEGEERGEVAVATGALLVELARADVEHLEGDQGEEELHRNL